MEYVLIFLIGYLIGQLITIRVVLTLLQHVSDYQEVDRIVHK